MRESWPFTRLVDTMICKEDLLIEETELWSLQPVRSPIDLKDTKKHWCWIELTNTFFTVLNISLTVVVIAQCERYVERKIVTSVSHMSHSKPNLGSR